MVENVTNKTVGPAAIDPSANSFVIRFKVLPGKNEVFEKTMGAVLLGVRENEPRNVYSDLLHLAQDSQTYLIVERYEDHDAAVEHSRSVYIEKMGEVFRSENILAGPPDVQELVFIRSK